jgi:hypothetical protein
MFWRKDWKPVKWEAERCEGAGRELWTVVMTVEQG